MVDFISVRPHRGSQNNGFEELVVQLARRRPPLDAKEFRRIEGAGGDAGVEALWLKNDGSSIGIQAKYFLRVRDIDWAQIDESIATTLKHRPEVNVYQIAIACDLTDKGGVKGRGRTGWATWDEHVKRWEADALALGRKVSFEPITASDLIDWLGQPSAAGLARYWFGTDVLGLPWFADQVRIASADLGERYTPDHHVDVAASLAFDGLARTATLRARLLRTVEATWKHRVGGTSATLSDDVREAAERADHALKRVHAIADAVGAPTTTEWDVEQWLSDARAAEQLLDGLDEELRKQERVAQESEAKLRSNSDHQAHFKYSIRKAQEALSDLARLLASVAFRGDSSRMLLVTGEAGTGKSHMLAAEANRSVAEGRPALLFLGQQFAQGNPWDQCERSLGLSGWPRDELFGALDAAGEATGSRTLILVDAVNEGAGANLWRSHLAGFIESIAPYPNVAVIVACRTEYVPFAIPKPILDVYPKVELHGFTKFEEQEAAAIQYLDRRGIVRPAGPLLAPEFSHPLFLKAASDALLLKRVFVFPRGLRGALNILGFYLDSIGGNLLPVSAEPANLSIELRRALQRLAQEMARTKLDYVPRSQADLIVTQTFAPRTPPAGMTWLEVLVRNGIVRLDPDPNAQENSSFVAPDDVARIAFQRFQDHLFVQASLSGATDATSLFTASGPLEWLMSSPKRYEWSGLFEALSIQIPETFDMELVDALPGGADRWWREWGIQEGFTQSVRWRAITSQAGHLTFTDRSLTLLNSIDKLDSDSLGLLLEVAAVPEHPWNANMLHRNLWRWGLNRRDQQWSRVIAFAAEDDEHPVHRLLKWANGGKLDHAEPKMLRLVAITLTWLCSSTSRYLRDTATRGLCRLLREVPSIHHDLLTMMVEVDDLYVLERLLAASYGAACQLGDDPILETMAVTTFDLVFNNRAPPQHLLARDYALGVLEVAQARGRLPTAVNMAKARPPFPTKAFRAPSQAVLEKRKEKLGDHSILWSCGEHGDFGRYEIVSAVNDFSATKLDEPAPLSKLNRFDLFVVEVATINLERELAFEALQKATKDVWSFRFGSVEGGFKITKTRLEAATETLQECEDAFLALLTHEERNRYVKDASHFLLGNRGNREPATFDPRWAQRWVTARAYSLGWTKERFGDDRTPSDHGRQRARIERVGKKYQWIALYELLAWLSDTHWLKGNSGEQPKRYSYPTDTAFQRDLDPTLAADADIQALPESKWWKLDFNMRSISDDQLTTWAIQNDPWHSARNAIFRTAPGNEEWVTLHSFQRAVERFSDRDFVRREIGLRREGFQFVHCLIVAQKELRPTYDALVVARDRNAHHWEPSELTDGPYLGEYGWRATWPSLEWSPGKRLPGDVSALEPVVEYSWESHLDASRPDGVNLRLPSQGLLGLLSLAPPTSLSPNTTVDHVGRAVIVHHKGQESGHSVTIRRDTLERLLVEHQLGCLWFVSAERSAWPTGGYKECTRRWFGSLIAFDGRRIKSFDWETPW
ncbi:hypothetical protein [Lysobacter capsici]|uniref:hypothetical protein n=1 Tax=Lysobacter capsici TaxID=435897 RepID=UPI001C007EB9|nr:hypothetical protein [Lysobacter capsici]QWF15228.1 hypothetical protein KME82_15640 [Lysobacter capsici]